MQGEEERAMGEDESQDNSQTEAAADETSRQQERSQTPQFGSVGGSDPDDDKKFSRSKQQTLHVWFPPDHWGQYRSTGDNYDS